jgi:hypothetical protein
MANAIQRNTRGKRTASKTALKRTPAGRRAVSSKSKSSFPGGSVKTKGEVKRVVPRMQRQTRP